LVTAGEHDREGRVSEVSACPLEIIGMVHTARKVTTAPPVQAALNRDDPGVVEIFEPYAEGLAGLAGFDYAWLLTWLDRPDQPGRPPLTQVPFLLRPRQQSMGVFATRGPRRVNPLGLSLVQLLEVDGRRVRFGGVDLLD